MAKDVRYIPLTQGYYAVVDAADYARVSSLKWHAQIAWRKGFIKHICARASASKTTGRSGVLLHRFILGLSDPSVEVDHRDGDALNNRRANLRQATRQQNNTNRGKWASKAGFKGVHKKGNKWYAAIWRDGRSVRLGNFTDPNKAAIAYNRAAREAFGEFAKLNQTGAAL
jgi:hypothetical protein